MFGVRHVSNAGRVKLDAYQLKILFRTWFDRWKEGRDEDAQYPSWAFFENAFLVCFFTR